MFYNYLQVFCKFACMHLKIYDVTDCKLTMWLLNIHCFILHWHVPI